MTLADFVTTNTGVAVSYDGLLVNKGQCEQLVCLYWEQCLGFKCPSIPLAKDLWTNSTILASFDQIPTGQEEVGDAAVWGASSLINSPVAGHTGIVLGSGFTSFDSNWGQEYDANGYPIAHEVTHDYQDVLGFLRLKEAEVSTVGETEFNYLFRAFFGDINLVTQEDRIKWIGTETNTVIREMEADPRYTAYTTSKGTTVDQGAVITWIENNTK